MSVVLVAAVSVAAAQPASANSKYAGFVIDAKTGRTLYEANADAPRYPASLTKMMTLYLVFEALSGGKISKSTRITFSRNAAAEPPTKLGVPAGKSITVETAILSLVTKSANDAATAIGEFLGGSEAGFAKMMTAKAHALGMRHTTFKNAHGLPNTAQTTTARDMAQLGIALREHFPQYYRYFSTRTFRYGKSNMGNHNHLLGRVKGVDGIKTGYTRASGFNLVASVRSNNRSIVAVVMGGKTGRSRDAHMTDLIRRYLGKASPRPGKDLVANAGQPTSFVASAVQLPKANIPTPAFRPEQQVQAMAYAAPAPERFSGAMAKTTKPAVAVTRKPEQIDMVQTSSTNRSGWVIQVASLGSESQARAFLDTTTSRASGLLSDASPFTQQFAKGNVTYYRARYSGFASKSAAWNACSALKRKDIACYAVQQ